jgi:Bacterial regulatory helix-turn-helix protein, lysR family
MVAVFKRAEKVEYYDAYVNVKQVGFTCNKWLEDFIALAHTRSFARAADLRSVIQPAFGRRIKSLEDWLRTAFLA